MQTIPHGTSLLNLRDAPHKMSVLNASKSQFTIFLTKTVALDDFRLYKPWTPSSSLEQGHCTKDLERQPLRTCSIAAMKRGFQDKSAANSVECCKEVM